VLSRRLKSESGFTLPELIVTLTIAMILSLATFSLIEVVMRRTADTTARIDAVQRGRTTMDIVTRDLRSPVCAWATNATPAMLAPRSLESASSTSVGVFVDFTDEAQVAGVSPAPSLRTISLAANGNLNETVQKGTWAVAAPNRTVLGAATTRTLTSGIASIDGIVFSYFKFDNANPPQPSILLATNRALTADELATVAKIRITYRAVAQRGVVVAGATRATARFQNEIYIRSADPNQVDPDNPTPPVPTCPTF
jgi:prepilin-type N-terminal cleavage/methylation domain-containing protein